MLVFYSLCCLIYILATCLSFFSLRASLLRAAVIRTGRDNPAARVVLETESHLPGESREDARAGTSTPRSMRGKTRGEVDTWINNAHLRARKRTLEGRGRLKRAPLLEMN